MPGAERTLRLEAVVIRHANWGESDRLLWLFTRTYGKLRAVAKGARRMRSRKAGHLEPFTRVDLLLARGRDLWIVTQAETIDAYLPVKENLLLTGYAAYIFELLDRFTYEEGENLALYKLLVDTMERIASEEDPFSSTRYFEIRLLDILGFRPELFHCVNCQSEILPEDQFFSALQGGAVCPRCAHKMSLLRPVSMQALKFLRHFQRSPYIIARNATFSAETRHEVEILIQYFLTHILERSLNSPAFLRQIQRLN